MNGGVVMRQQQQQQQQKSFVVGGEGVWIPRTAGAEMVKHREKHVGEHVRMMRFLGREPFSVRKRSVVDLLAAVEGHVNVVCVLQVEWWRDS
jgi:hypothetical protein